MSTPYTTTPAAPPTPNDTHGFSGTVATAWLVNPATTAPPIGRIEVRNLGSSGPEVIPRHAATFHGITTRASTAMPTQAAATLPQRGTASQAAGNTSSSRISWERMYFLARPPATSTSASNAI